MLCSVANVKKFKKSDHIHRGQDLDDRGSVFRPESQKASLIGLLRSRRYVFPQVPKSLP